MPSPRMFCPGKSLDVISNLIHIKSLKSFKNQRISIMRFVKHDFFLSIVFTIVKPTLVSIPTYVNFHSISIDHIGLGNFYQNSFFNSINSNKVMQEKKTVISLLFQKLHSNVKISNPVNEKNNMKCEFRSRVLT